jgi:hypothetical protein
MPHLPRTTDARLLAAIPEMQPWPEVSGNGRWLLREPGRHYLAFSSGKSELDLSAESGTFRVCVVDPRTGQVATRAGMVQAGKTVTLPPGVIWLIRE